MTTDTTTVTLTLADLDRLQGCMCCYAAEVSPTPQRKEIHDNLFDRLVEASDKLTWGRSLTNPTPALNGVNAR